MHGNKSYAQCTDNGQGRAGPMAKSLMEAESCVYDLWNVRASMFDLLDLLHQEGEEESEFFGQLAQCCNSVNEIYNVRNLERSLVVARANAIGSNASAYDKELAGFLTSVTDAEANAPNNADETIRLLTEKFHFNVGKQECSVFAKKAVYGDSGGGSNGGFPASRQEKEKSKKDKQRGARGGSDKRSADGDRRGSPRVDQHDSNQREQWGHSSRGNDGDESDGSRSHGRTARHEQPREPLDARGKTAHGAGGGGRGGGGARGGGRPVLDRKQRLHGEQTDASGSD